jgi:fumarate hydratase class II
MPGKVNPVLPGGDADGLRAGDRQRRDGHASPARGNFELNVMMPVIGRNLLESIRLLAPRQPAARRPVRRRDHRQRRAMRAYASRRRPW